jgi:hypothetical protein
MFIGYNMFGEGKVFDTLIGLPSFSRMEAYQGLLNEIYIDENPDFIFVIDRPEGWAYSTVLMAQFQNTLEAGSVIAGGFTIDGIKLQKRRWDELEWHDVGEFSYEGSTSVLYEVYDKIIANDFLYEYSLIPLAADVTGNRVITPPVRAEFEGVFLSDKDNNYQLLFDANVETINHISQNTKFEPLNSKYPIVVYSNLDYAEWGITATFISTHTVADQSNRQVNIRMEQLDRNKLLQFLNNKKPKIYRDMHGNLKLVSVIDNITEEPNSHAPGIATLGIKLVEIGDFDSDTLRLYDLLVGDK